MDNIIVKEEKGCKKNVEQTTIKTKATAKTAKVTTANKFMGTANEAREITETIGRDHFINFIFKTINRAARDGYQCIFYDYGREDEEHIDNNVINFAIGQLVSKGYCVKDLRYNNMDKGENNNKDEKIGILRISW